MFLIQTHRKINHQILTTCPNNPCRLLTQYSECLTGIWCIFPDSRNHSCSHSNENGMQCRIQIGRECTCPQRDKSGSNCHKVLLVLANTMINPTFIVTFAYRISSIRRRGYYFIRCSFFCGYYSRGTFEKPTDTVV